MIAKSKGQRKRKFKNDVIFQIIFVVLFLFLVGSLLISNLRISGKRTELKEKIELLMAEIETLEEKKQQLETGISETQKESYWEEKIREQGYVKEGENPVVVISSEESSEKEPSSKQGFSERLLEKIRSLLARVIQW